MLKRVNWFAVGMTVGGLAALAGVIWFLVWLWTAHKGLVIAVGVVVVVIGVAVAGFKEAEENREREATARMIREQEAEEQARQERLAAAEANRSKLAPVARAGWYPDPNDPGRERWWSGTEWADKSRPVSHDWE